MQKIAETKWKQGERKFLKDRIRKDKSFKLLAYIIETICNKQW